MNEAQRWPSRPCLFPLLQLSPSNLELFYQGPLPITGKVDGLETAQWRTFENIFVRKPLDFKFWIVRRDCVFVHGPSSLKYDIRFINGGGTVIVPSRKAEILWRRVRSKS